MEKEFEIKDISKENAVPKEAKTTVSKAFDIESMNNTTLRIIAKIYRNAGHLGVYANAAIVGQSGQGKSETLRNLAKDLKTGFFELNMGEVESPGELNGMPELDVRSSTAGERKNFLKQHKNKIMKKVSEENELRAIERSEPGYKMDDKEEKEFIDTLIKMEALETRVTKFFPLANWPTQKCIFFLDEVNRCNPLTRAFVHGLVLTRRLALSDWKMPEGSVFVAALNPPEENYEVGDMDKAFINRFIFLPFNADASDILSHYNKCGMDKFMIDEAFMDESLLGITHIESVIKYFPEIEATPRTYKMLASALGPNQDKEITNQEFMLMAKGCVGEEVASRLYQARNRTDGVRLIQPDEIIYDYKKVKSSVVKYASPHKSGGVSRNDILSSSLHKLLVHMKNNKIDRNSYNNICEFLKDLPDDALYNGARSISLKSGLNCVIAMDDELLDRIYKLKED